MGAALFSFVITTGLVTFAFVLIPILSPDWLHVQNGVLVPITPLPHSRRYAVASSAGLWEVCVRATALPGASRAASFVGGGLNASKGAQARFGSILGSGTDYGCLDDRLTVEDHWQHFGSNDYHHAVGAAYGLAIAVAGLVFLQLMIEGPLAFQGIAGMDNRWRLGLLAALMTMAGLSTLAAITVCAIWGYFYNNSAGDPLVQDLSTNGTNSYYAFVGWAFWVWVTATVLHAPLALAGWLAMRPGDATRAKDAVVEPWTRGYRAVGRPLRDVRRRLFRRPPSPA